MTKIIDLKEVIYIGGVENAILFSKEFINRGDLIIAQSSEENEEVWWDISEVKLLNQVKTGYTMYILTKHKNQ